MEKNWGKILRNAQAKVLSGKEMILLAAKKDLGIIQIRMNPYSLIYNILHLSNLTGTIKDQMEKKPDYSLMELGNGNDSKKHQ